MFHVTSPGQTGPRRGGGGRGHVSSPGRGLSARPGYIAHRITAPQSTVPAPSPPPTASQHIKCPSCTQISVPRVIDLAFHVLTPSVHFSFALLRSISVFFLSKYSRFAFFTWRERGLATALHQETVSSSATGPRIQSRIDYGVLEMVRIQYLGSIKIINFWVFVGNLVMR